MRFGTRKKQLSGFGIDTANADIHVGVDILRPNRKRAKNGTNFTFKYNRKPERCAVVVDNPIIHANVVLEYLVSYTFAKRHYYDSKQ